MFSLSLRDGVLTFRVNFFFWRRAKKVQPVQPVVAGPKPLPPPFPLPPLAGMPRRRTAGEHLMDAPALYAERAKERSKDRPKPPPPVPDEELSKTLDSADRTLPPDDETRAAEPSNVTNLKQQRALVRKALRATAR